MGSQGEDCIRAGQEGKFFFLGLTKFSDDPHANAHGHGHMGDGEVFRKFKVSHTMGESGEKSGYGNLSDDGYE
jgi:hypothetical protein